MKNLAKTDEKKDLVTREDLEKIELTPGPKGDKGADSNLKIVTESEYENLSKNQDMYYLVIKEES